MPTMINELISMYWKKYLSGTELFLPVGFNSDLYCHGNKLTKIVLPEGFNSVLDCSGNELTELVLPKGFNSTLYCYVNNLTKIVLPEGFNSDLYCFDNELTKLVLPKGYSAIYHVDNSVTVYSYEEWLAMERERIMLDILNDY